MSTRLFQIGLIIDAILLLLAAGNVLMMGSTVTSSEGTTLDASSGLTIVGRLALFVIPLGLLALMAGATALKKRGSLAAANVLLWLPALPFGIALLFWGGLAVIFALFSRQ